jgi:hypothetical protein
VVEHSAKGDTVDRAGLQAKPDDPASALIHDDQYPGGPQPSRFAAKEIHAPETVLPVAEESQPRRPAGVPGGLVRLGQDAPNDIDIGTAIEDLLLIWAASSIEEWRDTIGYIPNAGVELLPEVNVADPTRQQVRSAHGPSAPGWAARVKIATV